MYSLFTRLSLRMKTWKVNYGLKTYQLGNKGQVFSLSVKWNIGGIYLIELLQRLSMGT